MLFIQEVKSLLPMMRKEGCDLYFRIEKQDESCMIRYEDHENKGVTSAEFVEGQSSDALVSCSASEDADAKEQAHAIRKERKDIVKLALYRLLVSLTGKPFHGET